VTEHKLFSSFPECVRREARSQHGEDLQLLVPLLCMASYGAPATFAELGAFTGVELSNTVMLERCYNWTGALIEGNPNNFARVECCFLTKVVLFFNIRIHVHSYACVCIHMHFIVFCMHSDALHSTIWLHSNAFCNHFELLHSSDARRLHSDAFSYLLHSRHVTF
jgi:hypothetical protein